MSAPPADHDGKSPANKRGKAMLMASAALVTLLVTLVVGIVIGNATRRRFDKMSHGYG